MKKLLFLLSLIISFPVFAGTHSPLVDAHLLAPTCSTLHPNIRPPKCVDYKRIFKRLPLCNTVNPSIVPPACLAIDMPDSTLTPGSSFDIALNVICADGYEDTIPLASSLTNEVQHQVFVNYKFPFKKMTGPCASTGCTLDNLVPVSIGGNNTLVNLWPLPNDGTWNAAKKALLNEVIRERVCYTEPKAYQYVKFTSLTSEDNATGLVGDAAATAGKSTLAFTATPTLTATTALSLPATNYDLNFAINGAGAVNKTVALTGASTLTTIASAFNALPVTGVTVTASGNTLVATSSTTGAATNVAITAGTSANLIAAINLAKTATHAITNVVGTDVVNAVTYTSTITVGVTPITVSISGTAAQTFATLISEINTDLSTNATATLDIPKKRIKITVTAAETPIAIDAGTLFAPPLANFSKISTPFVGHPTPASLLVVVNEIKGNWKNAYVKYVTDQQ